MRFFKLVIIALLKTSAKTFGKICLKAIRDTWFQYMVCDQGREGELGVRSNKRGKFKLLVFPNSLP